MDQLDYFSKQLSDKRHIDIFGELDDINCQMWKTIDRLLSRESIFIYNEEIQEMAIDNRIRISEGWRNVLVYSIKIHEKNATDLKKTKVYLNEVENKIYEEFHDKVLHQFPLYLEKNELLITDNLNW